MPDDTQEPNGEKAEAPASEPETPVDAELPWAASAAVKDRILAEVEKRFSERYRKKFRSLVMLSGGVESVAILANLLKWTEGRVHAHFIVNVNKENRHEAEIQATEQAVTYCRENLRDFEFTMSKYELMLGLGGGLDLTLQMFMATRVNVATGGIFDVVWTGHNAVPWDQMAEGAAVFAAAHVHRRFKPNWVTPVRGLKKVDIYRSMPDELAASTWSCRTPVAEEDGTYSACGKCHSCNSMKAVRDAIVELENE